MIEIRFSGWGSQKGSNIKNKGAREGPFLYTKITKPLFKLQLYRQEDTCFYTISPIYLPHDYHLEEESAFFLVTKKL